MSLYLKQKFHIPIHRRDILDHVISHHDSQGLCMSICDAMYLIGHPCCMSDVPKWFPLFTFENARKFGASNGYGFWWAPGDWSGQRMEFLKWLRKEYQKDKTKLA